MAEGTRMQQRRATEAVWNTSNYILAAGEIGVTLDTGILKFGDGVNGWNALPIAFEGLYLPLLGKAADSELLDGVSADFFVKFADTDTEPTPGTYVQRTVTGTIKAATATVEDDLVNLAQLTASHQIPVVRTVTASTTAALTDINKMIFVNHASLTTQLTVTMPRNADVAFPVGSWIEICASGTGGAKIIPFDGTVGIFGAANVKPVTGVIRMLKIGPNEWLGTEARQGRAPSIKYRRTVAGDNYGTAYSFVPYDALDQSETYNPDNEWFTVPGGSMPTARRIVINKDGEYLFNINFASNGTGGVTFCQLRQMTADNSFTGALIRAVTGLNAVCSINARVRVTAGQSFGVAHGFAAGNLGKADAEATGGDPHNFKIIRVSD